jgi:uridine kinase
MGDSTRAREAALGRLADFVAEIVRPHVVRVAIDGVDAAGKTMLADQDSFDYEALRRDLLEPLGPGGSRLYRTRVFDHRADEAVTDSWKTAPEDAVLLFDGVFLLRPELDDLWDFRLLVEVDADEALRRAVLRDEDVFGSADGALRRYRDRYVRGQRLYVDEADPAARADVAVENTDPGRPELRVAPPG